MSPPPEPKNAPLDLSDLLGSRITLAITAEQGHGSRPEISLFIGILNKSDEGYEITPATGTALQVPTAWLHRVKVMDERVKGLLGGSDLLLPIPSAELETAGISYTVSANGAVDLVVGD
jgi:hypothetical protein